MRELSVTRRQVAVIAGLIVLALFLGGRSLVRGGASAAAERPFTGAGVVREASPRLVVHVVGAVRRPGLYRVESNSRISDAVRRAGGPTRRADLALINLAAPLADGAQILVPRRVPIPVVGRAMESPGPGVAGGPVRLNTATLADLDSLPGVGPVTAQKILDYRQKHGAFSSVDDLDSISGIGPARLEQLRDLVAP